jgi:hypothetical protein
MLGSFVSRQLSWWAASQSASVWGLLTHVRIDGSVWVIITPFPPTESGSTYKPNERLRGRKRNANCFGDAQVSSKHVFMDREGICLCAPSSTTRASSGILRTKLSRISLWQNSVALPSSLASSSRKNAESTPSRMARSRHCFMADATPWPLIGWVIPKHTSKTIESFGQLAAHASRILANLPMLLECAPGTPSSVRTYIRDVPDVDLPL